MTVLLVLDKPQQTYYFLSSSFHNISSSVLLNTSTHGKHSCAHLWAGWCPEGAGEGGKGWQGPCAVQSPTLEGTASRQRDVTVPLHCEARSSYCTPFWATPYGEDVNKPEGVWGKPLRWWGWSTCPARRGCGAEAGSAGAETPSGEILVLLVITCRLGGVKRERDPSQRCTVRGKEATGTGGSMGNSNFR